MPFESPDSSLTSSPVSPDAAAAPPRTPTGRLQPMLPFRKRDSASAPPSLGSEPLEVAMHPEALAAVSADVGIRESTDLANASPLADPTTPAPTVASCQTAAATPGPAAAETGGQAAVDLGASDVAARRSNRSSHRSQSRRPASDGRSRGRHSSRGTGREPSREPGQFAELAAIDLESTHVDGSTFRELSGLLLAFALSLALTQASLWWVVGVDPLGIAPTIGQWLPGIVPPGLRP